MIEYFVPKEPLPEPTEPAALIAAGLTRWFKAEHLTSANGTNKVLDDLPRLQADLSKSVEDTSNQRFAKVVEHLGRHTGLWWQQGFALDPTNDYFIAKQVFAAQMATTGARREQNLVQATDQEDYWRLKFSENPLGIDIQNAVEQRLISRFGSLEAIDFANADITTEELYETAKATTEYGYGMLIYLIEHGEDDIGKEDSNTVDRAKDMQTAWLNLAVDYVIYAAQVHDGDLTKVPFLQPFSISDQPVNRSEAVYYPFAAK